MTQISPRSYGQISTASAWEEIWETESYFERVAELLESANHSVIIVGWQLDSRLRLSYAQETLREKVLRLCQKKPNLKMYFLLWDHAYLYLLGRELWQTRLWENLHPHIYFVFDNLHPLGGCHHEKLLIIDGNVALCGGIDLCDNRWDSAAHHYSDRRRSLNLNQENHGPYHDLAVQLKGAVCGELQAHVAKRWNQLSWVPFPTSPETQLTSDSLRTFEKTHEIYLSRTFVPISRNLLFSPLTREIEFLFRDLIQGAKKWITIEGQYYWSKHVNDLLIAKIHEMDSKGFEITLILADLAHVKSLTYCMTTFELSLLRKLEVAAKFSNVKIQIVTPYVFENLPSPSIKVYRHPKPIYIHSKILIIDDSYLTIGSANLADRALRIDSELQLTIHARTMKERVHIRQVNQRILEHWKIEDTPSRDAEGTESNPIATSDPIYPRTVKPSLEMDHLKSKIQWVSRVPWTFFFDPSIPWFYVLRLRYCRNARKNKTIVFGDLIFIGLMSVFFALLTENIFELNKSWEYFAYFSLLILTWLLPVPFIFTSVFALLRFGPGVGVKISMIGLWIASGVGYFLIRGFPFFGVLIDPYFQSKQLIKIKNFQSLVAILLNPFISVRSKIIYQGLYFVPLPWFILGTWIILPAFIYAFMTGIWSVYIYETPIEIQRVLAKISIQGLPLSIVITALKTCIQLLSKSGLKNFRCVRKKFRNR